MPRVVQAVMFFPRGGSGTVARALARALPACGWDCTVVSGSLPGLGDAEAFYDGLDVRPAWFQPAGEVPMHPSYEDRADAPDRVFAAVDDAGYESHVDAWSSLLRDADAPAADVLHLHHLTPINEAARRVAPGVPIVGHLHGTELLMLEKIAEGRAPDSWRFAERWAARMRRWAQDCDQIVLISDSQVGRAVDRLGVDPALCTVLRNGFDPDIFDRRRVDRAAHWRAVAGESGARLAEGTVILYVGRFTAVKRVDLLVRAWAKAEPAFERPASLVIVGGHPGEWEGTHPARAIEETGARHVHLAGWRTHDELPAFLAASDAIVLPSVREQFGAVLVEAMACGLPAIAVNRFGPAEIIGDGKTGWLVEPDDEDSLAAALSHAVDDPFERRRRGRRAYADVRRRYAWPGIAERFADVLDQAVRSAEGEEAAV